MGYDSSIRITKKQIPLVKTFFQNKGFKIYENKHDKVFLLTFHCYADDDFKYFEGTSFSLIHSKYKYSICGRNSYSCSGFDLKLHNDTLVSLATYLSKNFYTDEGKNKPFQTGTLYKGMTNALAFPFDSLDNKFEHCLYFVSNIKQTPSNIKDLNKYFEFPSPIFDYESFFSNLMYVYLVGIIENYFKNTFINILKCINSTLFSKIEKNANVPNYAKDSLKKGEIDRFTAVACAFSFQTISNIEKTFLTQLGFNMNKLLSKGTLLRKPRREVFNDIFDKRHSNVHKLEYSLSQRELFVKQTTIVIKTINACYSELCKFYNVKKVCYPIYSSIYKRNLNFLQKENENNK